MSTILQKYPGDLRNFSFDFSQMEEILNGDTITAIGGVSATPTGLSLGSTAISGKTVTVVISGGVVNTEYVVSCTINTSSGAALVGEGLLSVLA